ncbi:MAG: radical SAM-associated putative lipoprotein [Bacteroidales bacterium]|nr:radical SAM-associated putative lipoprotein [Bacteroidales bacterium]
MKSRIYKLSKYLATAILGVLGFSSCGEEIEPEGMYGSPYASFKALGTVKDEAGKPIEGIMVSVRTNWDENYFTADTVYTDASGAYLHSHDQAIFPTITLVFEDVDGAEHDGEFKSTEVTPDFKKVADGDGSWHKGYFEAKTDIVLKKK